MKGAHVVAVVREVQERTQRLVRDLNQEGERLQAMARAVGADLQHLDTLEQAAAELVHGGDELQGKLAARDSALSILSAELGAKNERAGVAQRRQEQLELRVAELRHENDGLTERCASLERQAAGLARLYTALYQLHETLDPAQVVERIQEIVNGFLGSEELALLEVDGAGQISVTASMGLSAQALSQLPQAGGEIGAALQQGATYVADPAGAAGSGSSSLLTACVPLSIGHRVVGALAIFRLLPQKEALVPLDRDLLGLLGTQAARALYFARLHGPAVA